MGGKEAGLTHTLAASAGRRPTLPSAFPRCRRPEVECTCTACTLHGALCAGARTQWNRCTQACYMDFLSQQMLGLKVHLHIVNNLTGLATCGEV